MGFDPRARCRGALFHNIDLRAVSIVSIAWHWLRSWLLFSSLIMLNRRTCHMLSEVLGQALLAHRQQRGETFMPSSMSLLIAVYWFGRLQLHEVEDGVYSNYDSDNSGSSKEHELVASGQSWRGLKILSPTHDKEIRNSNKEVWTGGWDGRAIIGVIEAVI